MGAIRMALLAELYDEATAEAVRIQYGGSVKSSNVVDNHGPARCRWLPGGRRQSEGRGVSPRIRASSSEGLTEPGQSNATGGWWW